MFKDVPDEKRKFSVQFEVCANVDQYEDCVPKSKLSDAPMAEPETVAGSTAFVSVMAGTDVVPLNASWPVCVDAPVKLLAVVTPARPLAAPRLVPNPVKTPVPGDRIPATPAPPVPM